MLRRQRNPRAQSAHGKETALKRARHHGSKNNVKTVHTCPGHRTPCRPCAEHRLVVVASTVCSNLSFCPFLGAPPVFCQATIVASVALTSAYTPVLKPIPLVKNLVVAGVVAAAIAAGGLASGAGVSSTLAPSVLTFFVIGEDEFGAWRGEPALGRVCAYHTCTCTVLCVFGVYERVVARCRYTCCGARRDGFVLPGRHCMRGGGCWIYS